MIQCQRQISERLRVEDTYAIADTRRAILSWLQGVDQRDDDARARVADGVTERDRTTELVEISTHEKQKLFSSSKTYPLILIFAGSMPSIFSTMRTTTENASLTSKSEMSSAVRPAFLSARGRANAGALGKSMGSTPASA